MENNEWNRVFVKIMSWYPAWKPDKLVSASWYEELGQFDPDKILETVKLLGSENVNQYPPQVFHILKTLMGQQSKKLVAHEEWERVHRIACKGAPPGLVKKLSDETRRVVRALGGFPSLFRVQEKDLPFLKNKFLELFSEIAPPKFSGPAFTPLPPQKTKTLTAGES